MAKRQEPMPEPVLVEAEDLDQAPPLPVGTNRPQKDIVMGLAFTGTEILRRS